MHGRPSTAAAAARPPAPGRRSTARTAAVRSGWRWPGRPAPAVRRNGASGAPRAGGGRAGDRPGWNSGPGPWMGPAPMRRCGPARAPLPPAPVPGHGAAGPGPRRCGRWRSAGGHCGRRS
ncbi:hypothetical protein G6F68_010289 [Rhizopus microsporus]|nr:hypothetical protein G6F68_010289 [Rhizopus microsporus]KAG1385997.1 hypothetical protein G6F59_017081 [Rhizopus arrhizus]